MRSTGWSGSPSSSPQPPAEVCGGVRAVGIEDWSSWAYSWFGPGTTVQENTFGMAGCTAAVVMA